MKTFNDGIKRSIEICNNFEFDGYYDDFPSGQRNAIETIKTAIEKELHPINEDYVLISKKEYEALSTNSNMYNALIGAGVDNREGYGEAMESID